MLYQKMLAGFSPSCTFAYEIFQEVMMMKKKSVVAAALLVMGACFLATAFGQGKHTSSLDRCVRNCDMSYKSCMSSKKKSAHCAEKRRSCRTACAKSHGR